MRPLYLAGREPLDVALDGPALRVSSPGRADGRYPLRRLSRVIVSGEVEWQTRALTACLERGVPVTFLDREGRLLGYCFGARSREMPLAERLQELLDRPDWAARYGDWRAAEERKAILRALGGHRARLSDLRPAAVREHLLAGHLRLARPARVRRVHRLLVGMLAALSGEVLTRSGIRPELIGFRRRGLNLANDLTGLLEWELHATTRALLRERRRERLEQPAIAAAFERAAPRLLRRGHGHLGALERWLRELWT